MKNLHSLIPGQPKEHDQKPIKSNETEKKITATESTKKQQPEILYETDPSRINGIL